jgi:hypothetical protein
MNYTVYMQNIITLGFYRFQVIFMNTIGYLKTS